MKIMLDDRHVLMADQYCCWIEQLRTSEKGRVYSVRMTGYCASLGRMMDDYINKKFMGAEVETLKELIKEVDDLKAEVREMIGDLDAKILEALS